MKKRAKTITYKVLSVLIVAIMVFGLTGSYIKLAYAADAEPSGLPTGSSESSESLESSESSEQAEQGGTSEETISQEEGNSQEEGSSEDASEPSSEDPTDPVSETTTTTEEEITDETTTEEPTADDTSETTTEEEAATDETTETEITSEETTTAADTTTPEETTTASEDAIEYSALTGEDEAPLVTDDGSQIFKGSDGKYYVKVVKTVTDEETGLTMEITEYVGIDDPFAVNEPNEPIEITISDYAQVLDEDGMPVHDGGGYLVWEDADGNKLYQDPVSLTFYIYNEETGAYEPVTITGEINDGKVPGSGGGDLFGDGDGGDNSWTGGPITVARPGEGFDESEYYNPSDINENISNPAMQASNRSSLMGSRMGPSLISAADLLLSGDYGKTIVPDPNNFREYIVKLNINFYKESAQVASSATFTANSYALDGSIGSFYSNNIKNVDNKDDATLFNRINTMLANNGGRAITGRGPGTEYRQMNLMQNGGNNGSGNNPYIYKNTGTSNLTPVLVLADVTDWHVLVWALNKTTGVFKAILVPVENNAYLYGGIIHGDPPAGNPTMTPNIFVISLENNRLFGRIVDDDGNTDPVNGDWILIGISGFDNDNSNTSINMVFQYYVDRVSYPYASITFDNDLVPAKFEFVSGSLQIDGSSEIDSLSIDSGAVMTDANFDLSQFTILDDMIAYIESTVYEVGDPPPALPMTHTFSFSIAPINTSDIYVPGTKNIGNDSTVHMKLQAANGNYYKALDNQNKPTTTDKVWDIDLNANKFDLPPLFYVTLVITDPATLEPADPFAATDCEIKHHDATNHVADGKIDSGTSVELTPQVWLYNIVNSTLVEVTKSPSNGVSADTAAITFAKNFMQSNVDMPEEWYKYYDLGHYTPDWGIIGSWTVGEQIYPASPKNNPNVTVTGGFTTTGGFNPITVAPDNEGYYEYRFTATMPATVSKPTGYYTGNRINSTQAEGTDPAYVIIQVEGGMLIIKVVADTATPNDYPLYADVTVTKPNGTDSFHVAGQVDYPATVTVNNGDSATSTPATVTSVTAQMKKYIKVPKAKEYTAVAYVPYGYTVEYVGEFGFGRDSDPTSITESTALKCTDSDLSGAYVITIIVKKQKQPYYRDCSPRGPQPTV